MSPVKVLIVEDDEILHLTMQKMLMDEGFAVVGGAASGEAAVEQTREKSPDVILMDISLEGEIDGVETANRISEFSETPIIYLSSYTDEATIERAKKTGPFGYVLKPFTRKELAITVEVALYKHALNLRLRDSELRLSTILSNIPSGVIHADANGNIAYMSPNAELFTQRSAEHAAGKPVSETLNICEVTGDCQLLDSARMLSEADSWPSQGRLCMLCPPGGERRIAQVTLTPIRDAGGSVHGSVIVLSDVTKSHEVETRNRALAAALESLDDAVAIAEPDFGDRGPLIVDLNESFTRLTGWSRQEAAGKRIGDLAPRADASDFLGDMRESLATNGRYSGEASIPTSGQEETLTYWDVSTVSDNEGRVLQRVFVIRDITHLRRLEENIRQSQKIEAVGRLAGGIAHDFNNLLSVINSYSDLMALKLDDDSPVKKYATQIRAAGRRGADLVSQLMTFSRREKPAPTILDLKEATEQIKDMLCRIIRENIQLIAEYDDELRAVKADRGQFEQTLMNLCVNARDAMPNGGSIKIEIRNRDVSPEQSAAMGYLRPGRYVALSLLDCGCGMDDETAKRIFEPFFTTKEIGQGTGLGLSTAYGVMKQLGGHIFVESELGKGTRFDLYFPAVRCGAELEDGSEKSVPISKGAESVFIVEDDETFLDCISGLMSLHGYVVTTAKDGLDALELLEEKGEQIQLLVSDLVLPNVSGRELAGRLLEKNPEAKVIFMTGYDDQLDAFQSFEGDAAMLQKPFPLNTLLAKAREMLDKVETRA